MYFARTLPKAILLFCLLLPSFANGKGFVLLYESEVELEDAAQLVDMSLIRPIRIASLDTTACENNRFLTLNPKSAFETQQTCPQSDILLVSEKEDGEVWRSKDLKKLTSMNLDLVLKDFKKVGLIYTAEEEKDLALAKDVSSIKITDEKSLVKAISFMVGRVDAIVLGSGIIGVNEDKLKQAAKISVKNSVPLFGGGSREMVNQGVLAGYFGVSPATKRTVEDWIAEAPLYIESVFVKNSILESYMGIKVAPL
jgi:hypothetical protein